MISEADKQPNPVDHLPDSLQRFLAGRVDLDAVAEASPFDLDEAGAYCEGYLVLWEDRLGSFRPAGGEGGSATAGGSSASLAGIGGKAAGAGTGSGDGDGRWTEQWLSVADLAEAHMDEGLGLNMIRLIADGRRVAEYRFTLRHAKTAARLHRRLERLLSGDAGDDDQPPPEPPSDANAKKIRCEKCNRVIPPWSEFCPACTSRRKVLSRLLDFVKPYKTRAIFGLVLAVATTLIGLAVPWMTRPMLDKGLGLARGYEPNYSRLMGYVGIVIALTLLAVLGRGLRMRMMALLGSRIARDIRHTTYDHMHKLSLSFFSQKATGSLITRITSDSDRVWDFVAFTLVEALVTLLTIFGVGVALFWMNWRLACIVVIPIPIMLGMMVFFHNRMHRLFRRIWHRWSKMTAVVGDALPGVRVIKAFSQEKREVDRFDEANDRVYDASQATISIWTLFGPLLELCNQIGRVLVWVVGGYWVVRGWLTPGTMVAFIGYMWRFYGPIHSLAHMDRALNRAATSVQRIFEVLDTEPGIYSRSDPRSAGDLRGEIELQNVTFSYDGVRRVLHGIDLKIAAGEMIGLAGPSGGGKTTTINLICRFYDVLEGRILIDGIDVREYNVEKLRRHIGVVLQEPFLFHGTVAQNIAYGNPGASVEDIIRAAQAANAHDFIVGFPDGYDTRVGERGHTLSGGERQRISIARAVLNDPKILILDEATSSVDTETEKLIQEALDRLVANRTTIAIAHRLSTLRKADRLVILDKGKIVEQGTHEQLTAKADGLYAKLLNMQNEMQAIMAL